MSSVSLFLAGLFLGAAWVSNGNAGLAAYYLAVSAVLALCSAGIRMQEASR